MTRIFELAGVEVPRIGLGTNRLTDSAEGVTFVRAAVEAGLRHIDTAHLYTRGASERAIGKAVPGGRDDLVIATKGGYGGAGQGHPGILSAQIEQSLRALQTDTIDLYYLHRVDPDTPLEESLGAITAYVQRGAIRAVGLSDVTVEQIERGRAVVPIAAVQNRFNLDTREDGGVIDHCAAEGIAFVPYFPLAGPASVSNADKLARLLERAPNVLPIPGTLSIAHLRENLAVLEALCH